MRPVVGAIALVLASFGCTSTTGTARVTVTADGKPLARAVVVITDEDGRDLADAPTNAQGVAELQLETGEYHVTARSGETTECQGAELSVTESRTAEATIDCDPEVPGL